MTNTSNSPSIALSKLPLLEALVSSSPGRGCQKLLPDPYAGPLCRTPMPHDAFEQMGGFEEVVLGHAFKVRIIAEAQPGLSSPEHDRRRQAVGGFLEGDEGGTGKRSLPVDEAINEAGFGARNTRQSERLAGMP